MNIAINGDNLTLEHIIEVSRNFAKVGLDEDSRLKVQKARELVEKIVSEERAVYGITTGFGKFCDTFIDSTQTAALQRNLIVSHSCGVGQPFATEVVRALMLLRANSLAKGFSGVRVSTIEALLTLLNRRVHPIVPSQGSLGASGDLAPLSHVVLVLIGEGEAEVDGRVYSGKEALALRGLDPIELSAKEGLALINGTQAMQANLALAIFDSINAIKAS
ncbi:MAG: aromatic amino acid lyase, partial [bacterium]|nr:aromatic amino acid lyase [bacterium]